MTIPGSANPLLLASKQQYLVQRSIRLNSSDSAYLSRTPASAGNRKLFTLSFWCKRSGLSTEYRPFDAGNGASATQEFTIIFRSDNAITFGNWTNAWDWQLITTPVFRDPSAWQHFVFVIDTDNATAAQRARIYVNGSEIATFATASYPSSGFTGNWWNNTNAHWIGGAQYGGNYFSGYLADIHFIDGQALTPSSFTEVSATTGRLEPKQYTGSFGTNGFWLQFADNSNNTAATLGKDTSGNGNNWTPNNLSVTAGAGNDSLVDTPTSYGTDDGLGGSVRGNYCTWNPLWANSAFTLSNGNLDLATSSVSDRVCASTFGLSSGKWYWEITINGGAGVGIGVCTSAVNLASYLGGTSASRSYDWSANKYPGGASYGATYTTGDVIGVAIDVDAGTLVYYKNGVSQGTAFTDLAGSTWFPALGDNSSSGNVAISANFGQRPWAYTPPANHRPLVDTCLPAPVVAKPSTVMDVKLYTGNGSTQTISGLGFSPDLVWTKSRSSGLLGHRLQDIVRGATKELYSNATNAETTNTNSLTSFNSDGFSIGSENGINQSGETFVAWTWDAGTSTVTNTQGSITSSVRANTSAGFSIVSWTGNGATNATVGHGLGVTPAMIIVKNRNTTNNWAIWFSGFTANEYMIFTTAAKLTFSTQWGSTPTSTVFGVADVSVNGNGNSIIAYCFAPVAGYSSFGSYVGNGSATDGPFVYTGFRPRWVMYKDVSNANAWVVVDTTRQSYNVIGPYLLPNAADAEGSTTVLDMLSNGFKIRVGTSSANTSGATIIYAAFAENPFQYARAR